MSTSGPRCPAHAAISRTRRRGHYRVPVRKIGAGVACVAVCLLAACGSGAQPVSHTGAVSGKTAAQIVSDATGAATAVGSVHYVLTVAEAKQAQTTVSGDATNTGGRQQITIGALSIQVVLVHGVAYAMGDAKGLESFMGVASTQAPKYANRWIAIHQSDSLYPGVSQAVTLGTALAQLTPSGTLKLSGTKTLHGRDVIGIRGGLPAPAQQGLSGSTTLYVATTHPTLPIGFSETSTAVTSSGTQRATTTGSFTKWGEHVSLKAPTTGVVAFSSIPTK